MKLGVVDDARIQQFFAELATMQVPLEPDPVSMGPGSLQEKLTTLRRHLDRWQRMYETLTQELQIVRRRLRVVQFEYQALENQAIRSNPEVRAKAHVKDRKAVFADIHAPMTQEIHDLQSSVADLETFKEVLDTKKKDLMDISSRIKDQMALVREELSLGRRWGDRKPLSQTSSVNPALAGQERVDVESVLESVGQLPLEGGDEDALDVLLGSVEVPDSVEVLDHTPPATPTTDEFDLDDLLNGL